ncbi:hypothetical protein [Amycolatopsis azurea]|uniref:hypothetical protein n=1 Tax=Amycolatopsis azurea TaxID=36819 RepID=UPI0011780D39|nr:hypothetical protein [Amycolatopsis azurea]
MDVVFSRCVDRNMMALEWPPENLRVRGADRVARTEIIHVATKKPLDPDFRPNQAAFFRSG